MKCYVFDLDGTICNIDHRLHYILPPKPAAQWSGAGVAADLAADAAAAAAFKPDWDSFFAACVGDIPIEPVVRLLADLARSAPIVFCSSRSEVVTLQTIEWMRLNVPAVRHRNLKLYMRKDGDHRADHVVKGELLDRIIADGYEPIMAFEDRDQVVKMYRERGITCCQVAEGNF